MQGDVPVCSPPVSALDDEHTKFIKVLTKVYYKVKILHFFARYVPSYKNRVKNNKSFLKYTLDCSFN